MEHVVIALIAGLPAILIALGTFISSLLNGRKINENTTITQNIPDAVKKMVNEVVKAEADSVREEMNAHVKQDEEEFRSIRESLAKLIPKAG